MHKENAALSKVRPLLTQLSGDHTWASCEMFLGSNDNEFFDDGYMSRVVKRRKIESQGDQEGQSATAQLNGGSAPQSAANGATGHGLNGVAADHHQLKAGTEDTAMVDGSSSGDAKTLHKPRDTSDETRPGDISSVPHNAAAQGEEMRPTILNGVKAHDGESGPANGVAESLSKSKGKGKDSETPLGYGDTDVVMGDDVARVDHSHSLQTGNTNSQANKSDAASSRALMDESFIHPIFLAPKSAHPDRNLGLPDQEAEDVRRLLQLYVQKQEEVCRGARKLYEGLLLADRRRKTVLAWSKAEAHCGANRDMSDGEDWYDKDEWDLAEDLKKGQDEEEEDTTQTQKKTRNRAK